MVLFQNEGKIFQVPADQWKPVFDSLQGNANQNTTKSSRLADCTYLGTETPRSAAHRQPVARPRRAPGRSRLFAIFLSLEDDLMRIFGGERIQGADVPPGMTEGVPIESRMISSRIEKAQQSVEAQNFDARNICSSTTM